jgi:hypothetical protein
MKPMARMALAEKLTASNVRLFLTLSVLLTPIGAGAVL